MTIYRKRRALCLICRKRRVLFLGVCRPCVKQAELRWAEEAKL